MCSLVWEWKEYIQIFVDFIINYKAKQKRTKINKYCIDYPTVDLKAPLSLECTKIPSLDEAWTLH